MDALLDAYDAAGIVVCKAVSQAPWITTGVQVPVVEMEGLNGVGMQEGKFPYPAA